MPPARQWRPRLVRYGLATRPMKFWVVRHSHSTKHHLNSTLSSFQYLSLDLVTRLLVTTLSLGQVSRLRSATFIPEPLGLDLNCVLRKLALHCGSIISTSRSGNFSTSR